jgi:hypothetical protein
MITLPKSWYTVVIPEGVDLARPGIYEWRIQGSGSYIGRYTYSSRPFGEYEKNVLKMLNGRHYRPQKPDGFRRIHRELFKAHNELRDISLIILENCLAAELNERERYYRNLRGNLNGREKFSS